MDMTDIRSPNLARGRLTGKRMARGEGGIVVSQNREAARIGAEVLKEGGNAVDAIVAASFAVGVLEPWMSGVGGVGAMLVREEGGAVTAIDAGARSPAGLDPADFPIVGGSDGDLFGWPSVLEDRNVTGARSIGVPGLVAGLGAAHARFGRMSWAELVLPAAGIAEAGPVVDFHTTLWIASEMRRILRDEACSGWFLPEGVPPITPAAVTGRVNRLPNAALAQTLARIAREGPGILYGGELAEALAGDVQAAGGYLGTADLAAFEVAAGPAATQAYRRHLVHYVPGLNGGPTLAHMLRACQERHAPQGETPGAADVLAYCEAMQDAWAHRFETMGDGARESLPSCTTHLSAVDRDGMAVSLTQTLLSLFGSGVVSPRTGILLNNGINWFDPRPGRPNSIAPGRKALSNYAPAIMTGPDDDVIAIGGSGGRKILPAVFQALAQVADFSHALDEAVAAPRLDTSAPPLVVADARFPADILDAVRARHATVLCERMEHPNHFTTLGAVRRRGAMNEGFAEPFHPWADAVSEDDTKPLAG
ncbi:gamma-glutamyltransferase [Aureimonas populi]|uniref:Gamma-glutamyltransferase n=1 Tax=Aureimonas populi TaxID=1701758 RepID=A0ABW5CTH1_9HYPH|nr:gamma-glutamyltransferase [Aureimonas populi]